MVKNDAMSVSNSICIITPCSLYTSFYGFMVNNFKPDKKTSSKEKVHQFKLVLAEVWIRQPKKSCGKYFTGH